MVDWAVVRDSEATEDDLGVKKFIGGEQGAIHLDVAVVTLEPAESHGPASNPFEESFYILEGGAILQLGGRLHDLKPDDFGYVPVGMPHRWENRTAGPTRYLRVRSPQPRVFGSESLREAQLNRLSPEVAPEPVDPSDPSLRFLGRYDERSLPSPGPLQMKGFRSGAARNVGLWMMIDEMMGAVHHTLFMVQFTPTGDTVTLGGQHFHPFEEIYLIVEGQAIAHLEDESIEVGVGDVVFAGVNALHGFSNPTDERVRWIEAQAPAPPPAEAFFFPSHWTK